jgi:hypothetical protein
MPATYFPFRWMLGTFQEILDSSSGNSARIKSMTDLRVLSFAGSCEAKYSSTELHFGDLISFRLPFVGHSATWFSKNIARKRTKDVKNEGEMLRYITETKGFLCQSQEVYRVGSTDKFQPLFQ